MLADVILNEDAIKDKILEGFSVDDVIEEAIEDVKSSLKSKFHNDIMKTKEYKDLYGEASVKIKTIIKDFMKDEQGSLIKEELKNHLENSQVPKIVKAHVNEFLKTYVDEQIEKQIRKVYSIEIGVKRMKNEES